MLASTAETLRTMPHLTAAFQAGLVGWAEVRTIVCEVRTLPVDARAAIDEGFAEQNNIVRRDADRLLDEVRAMAASLRPDRPTRTPPGTSSGASSTSNPSSVAPAGRATSNSTTKGSPPWPPASRPPCPPRRPAPTTSPPTPSATPTPTDDDESQTADGDPAFCDPIPQRVRARQRADALVLLAETFLAGTRADGTPRRARPRILVACELQDLVGEVTSRTARLLTAIHGANPAVTQEALRRLASDADLQLIITDHGQTVGVTAPTSTIPARVRAAVAARDQGCRFPGCRMPIQFTDCHHVKPREDHGPTIISNLVALCRRHHTAVTEGRWKLTMTQDGTVTVRRGRRKATSDPPSVTLFRGPPRQPPGPAEPAGTPYGSDPPG
jgi:hypothetical protein